MGARLRLSDLKRMAMRNIGFKRVKKGLCGALGVLLCASLVGSAAFYENGSTVSAQTATDGGASTATVSGSSNGKVNETALSSKEAENAFLQANDEIWVIGTLNGDGLISYAEKANMPLADYAATGKGKHKVNSMIAEQQQAVRSLGSAVLETKYNYTTVFNGVSMKIRYKDLKKLEESGYFKSVIISESYAVPDAVTENVVNVWEDTGIYKTEGVTSYTGQGTVIAVLDTGLDYTHSAFAMSNFPNLDTDNLALTYDDVQAKAETLEAAKTTAGLDADDVYISYKVPYAYDYADKDTDVYPNEDHGTHVAGIIGGKDDVITGVAVNSQLAIFKVFSNHKSGAETADILAAISDAVLLGVDAINMSLGTSCGFSREEDEENVNEI